LSLRQGKKKGQKSCTKIRKREEGFPTQKLSLAARHKKKKSTVSPEKKKIQKGRFRHFCKGREGVGVVLRGKGSQRRTSQEEGKAREFIVNRGK